MLAIGCPSLAAAQHTQQSANGQGRTKVEFERELEAKRALLAREGALLEFNVINNAWGYLNKGCLIGSGTVYHYDVKKTPPLEAVGTADAGELAAAADLANAMRGQRIQLYSSILFDGSIVSWTATVGGNTITLKESGKYEGELEDNRARKLVSMIGQWCPDAADAFVRAEHVRPMLRGPPSPFTRPQ
jgi:hypothetical protein